MFMMCLMGSLAKIKDLNSSNFIDLLQPTFIKFYAPWCGHCQNLKPKFEALSESTKVVDFAQVDCTVEQRLCSARQIRGFPTLLLFRDHTFTEYNGERTVEDMKMWLESMFKPILEERSDAELKEEAKSVNKSTYFVMEVSQDVQVSSLAKYFNDFRGKIVIGLQYASETRLIAHRSEKTFILSNITAQEVTKFISRHNLPLFQLATPQNFGTITTTSVPAILLYGNDSSVPSVTK